MTREASQTAGRASKRTVLVNGDELAQLMIEHEVGVSRKVILGASRRVASSAR